MIDLRRDGDVFILRMGNGENRFSPEFLGALQGALNEVAAADGPRALVVTGTDKFFTNGLDLDWLGANPTRMGEYLDMVDDLFARVITMPCPTAAAINGHAFGAGAMLALCVDHRVMRTERGFWSLPEAALSMPFTRGMAALIRTRIPDGVATEAILTSARYDGDAAAAAGILEEAVPAETLLDRARELAVARAGLVGPNLAVIKRGLRLPLLDDLAVPTPPTLL